MARHMLTSHPRSKKRGRASSTTSRPLVALLLALSVYEGVYGIEK